MRQLYETSADLLPWNKTLTVRLHHLTALGSRQSDRHLGEELTATETLFPEAPICA
jgi:hypothetical protein